MIIRYRRYLNPNANVFPVGFNRIVTTPYLFVPCRTFARRTWASPFIIYTLPTRTTF